jgi:dTDP-4-amino-4,6-dideoxygalactose transaminase
MANAKPVFVDINPDIFCITPHYVATAINSKTKAIIPVHLMGHPALIPRFNYNIKIIEDACQSIGATHNNKLVGTMGNCGIFSFNQSKHISSGEGGMLITDDADINEVAMAVRNHGEVSAPELGIFGYNYRLSEIHAAIALEQFKQLDKLNAHRIMLADYLTDRLSRIDGLIPPTVYPNCKHVYYTYAVKFNKDIIGMSRDEFQRKMIEKGVYFGNPGGGYVKPLYLLPVFQKVNPELYKEGYCPVAERLWKEELCVTDIVRYPYTLKDMKEIVKTVEDVLGK